MSSIRASRPSSWLLSGSLLLTAACGSGVGSDPAAVSTDAGMMVVTSDAEPTASTPMSSTAAVTSAATLAPSSTSTSLEPAPALLPIPTPSGPHCVADVAPTARLDVRSGPGTDYPVVGTLGYDAIDVIVTGAGARDQQGRLWLELVDGGFAASWLLTPPPCEPSPGRYPAFTAENLAVWLQTQLDLRSPWGEIVSCSGSGSLSPGDIIRCRFEPSDPSLQGGTAVLIVVGDWHTIRWAGSDPFETYDDPLSVTCADAIGSPWGQMVGYPGVVAEWFRSGAPPAMDVDGDGMPCEDHFDSETVATVWWGPGARWPMPEGGDGFIVTCEGSGPRYGPDIQCRYQQVGSP